MTTPACSCCGVSIPIASIVPDGTYQFGEMFYVSFKCVLPCKTNHAMRFKDIPPELRRAAMLADLARDATSEMDGRG